jgi:hypothetical protein
MNETGRRVLHTREAADAASNGFFVFSPHVEPVKLIGVGLTIDLLPGGMNERKLGRQTASAGRRVR